MEQKAKHVLVISDSLESVLPMQQLLNGYTLSFGLLKGEGPEVTAFKLHDYDSLVEVFQLAIKRHGSINHVISYFPNGVPESTSNSDRVDVPTLPLLSVWVTKLATFYFRQEPTMGLDKRLILVAPAPASKENSSNPLSGLASNSLLGLLRSLQHQAFFEGIRLSLVYSNDAADHDGQAGTLQSVFKAVTIDQALTLETNGKVYFSDGRVISNIETTMAGVTAYAKLGFRLVGLNALKSGIQSASRRTARFLTTIGITPQYLQVGFIILAAVPALWLAWNGWFPSIVYVALGFAIWRSLISARQRSASKSRNRSNDETCSTAVFLGSGGHTGEAIQLLSALDPARYNPRQYIFCTGDTMSLKKATAFEHGLQTPSGTARQTMGEAFQFIELPRARKVGQSYLSSIGTTLYSLAITFWKLAAKPILTRQMHQIPDLLIVNGPGTCVMVVLVYKLLRVMGQRSPEIIYVESFARVTSLSLSGKILKNVVDRFIVQWPVNEDNASGAGKVGDDGAVSNVGKNKESLSNVEYHGWLI